MTKNKINVDRDKKVFLNFAKLPYLAKINILQNAFGIKQNRAEAIYAKIFSEVERQNRILKFTQEQKNIPQHEAEIFEKLQRLRILRSAKTEPKKRKKIRQEIGTITTLRTKKWSWADISNYCQKYLHFKVSDRYLKKIFDELQHYLA